MKRNIRIVFYTIIFTCTFLSLFGQSVIKITLNQDFSIGGENSEDIYQCASLCTGPEGNIYLTDIMDYSIKKFNSTGEFLGKTGRRGGGPGEFNAIRLIMYKQSKLYVTDQYKPGIQVFTENLKYIKTISYNKPIADICSVSKDLIAVVGVVLSGEGYIDIIDSSGKIIRSVMYEHGENNLPIAVMAHFKIDNNGNIYIASLFKDRIVKTDSKGKLIWKKNMFGKTNPRVEQIDGMSFPKDTFYKFVELDTSGNIFILGGGLSKNPSKDIYVFNEQGDFITTITLDQETHFIHIDKENKLYSREMLSTKIVQYEIIY